MDLENHGWMDQFVEKSHSREVWARKGGPGGVQGCVEKLMA